MAMKRKNDATSDNESGKKLRLSSEEGSATSKEPQTSKAPSSTLRSQNNVENEDKRGKSPDSSTNNSKKLKIRKLTPARPWPIVPTSVSATGPRSAHKDGKNMICISRRTGLGAYMRRCKDVILKDGYANQYVMGSMPSLASRKLTPFIENRYKVLHLSAMGAAIPLLLQLVCALPPILPFGDDVIKTEVTTGTCDVQDEVLPGSDEEDEDISVQQRSKSTLRVVITIGDGKFEGDTSGPIRKSGKNGGGKGRSGGGKGKTKANEPLELVYAEPDQDELMDAL